MSDEGIRRYDDAPPTNGLDAPSRRTTVMSKPSADRQVLHCFKCGSEAVISSESQQMLLVKGQKRLHADVRCKDCGHRWWSRHSTALENSRILDQELAPPERLEGA